MPSSRAKAGRRSDDRGPVVLTVARRELAVELEQRIQAGERLIDRLRNVATEPDHASVRGELYTWDEYNAELLRKRIRTTSIADHYARWHSFAVVGGLSLDEEIQRSIRDVQFKIRKLTSVKERLPLFEEAAPAGAAPATRSGRPMPAGNTAFVVHGRANETKQEVARFLERLGIDVQILHEQPNKGRTLIEKFEGHAAHAAFAVVLLTGDDVGGLAPDDLKPRARQNVVFEFGFFFGALGRNRVAVLHEDGVELPSDVNGVIYIPLDGAGAWKMLLARELKGAGLDVDMNKAV